MIMLFYLGQGFPTFFSEGHISYYAIVRRPDILRIMFASVYVTFCPINRFFVNVLFVHY